MPAAARNYSHPPVEDEIATPSQHARGARTLKSPRPATRRSAPRRKQHDHRATRPRAAAAVAAPVSPSTVPEWQRMQPLVEHFTEADFAPPVQTEPRPQVHDERALRRLARKRHRPFQMSLFSILVSAWMFTVLVMLLWWSGRASSALQRSINLDKDIELVRRDITNAQREISALDSSPHLAQWARNLKWDQATSGRIDDVTKAIPPRLEAPPAILDTPAVPPSATPSGGGRR